MSLIPEEFAVVWTVMLALGAWRLARAQVLTRQPQAIEALGTVTVLCVDKTGTLTRNHMALVGLHDGNHEHPLAPDASLPPAAARLLHAAARASVPHGMEPMDRAIFDALRRPDATEPGWTAGPHAGIREGHPYVLHWWRQDGEATHCVAVKGGAEAVLALCRGEPAQQQALRDTAQAWGERGLRVLAVACGEAAAPGAGAQLPEGTQLKPLGLLAFMDPLRAEVPQAMAECRRAGVRVVMITGDSPLTARTIARQAGLVAGELQACEVMTGREVADLSDTQLLQAVRRVQVFARVDPAQKLRIVQALQQQGEVVGMTGDGVNDAPALRAADIGVAMGQRGTDVAREASALVLLDDNFASLVQAVRAGRRIFINLQKALGYLFAVHVPIVGVSLLPVLMGGPVLLLPVHVVLLELIIDPACSLVFEAEPAPDDTMAKPPRKAHARLFTLKAAARALGIGAITFIGVLGVQWLCGRGGASPEMLRLASLGSIVVGNLLMLLWFRGLRPHHDHTNPAFQLLVAGVSAVSVLLLGVPGAGALFGLPAAVPPWWAGIAALPGAWALWRWFLGRSAVDAGQPAGGAPRPESDVAVASGSTDTR
jgi:Ca2+-transporting ATPase